MNRVLLLAAGVLTAIAFAACDFSSTEPTATTMRDVTMTIDPYAGAMPLQANTAVNDGGLEYRVSLMRFFVSNLVLLDTAGNRVGVTQLDSAGNPLEYNLTLWDLVRPESHTIRFRVPEGAYTGVEFSMGVPDTDATWGMLNHSDASLMHYPLDVDADMYWAWNPGYVFFKVEGQSHVDTAWTNFVYHVGEDRRMMQQTLMAPFTVSGTDTQLHVRVDADRLFESPAGDRVPDITGTEDERIVHGGAMADSMVVNVTQPGFATLVP